MTPTLLLADDSVTIQRVIELTFAEENVHVVTVGDGDAAIARLEREAPDIVLADVGMPGKNGYEIATYMKHSPRLSHIPVLLLTGAFEPVDQRRINELGCDGVLAKPFEPQFVIGRVKELLRRSRGGAEPAPSVEPPPTPAAVMPALEWPVPITDDAGAPGSSTSADDFFEQLDAAFAKLPAEPPTVVGDGLSPTGASPQRPFELARPEATQVASEPAVAQTEPHEPPEPTEPAEAPGETETVPLTSAPLTSVAPGLAEAFAALLAAEERAGATSQASRSAVPAPLLTDELIERVTERVLERLSDQVVRETAAHLVSTIAERLVREEIDRIKATIK